MNEHDHNKLVNNGRAAFLLLLRPDHRSLAYISSLLPAASRSPPPPPPAATKPSLKWWEQHIGGRSIRNPAQAVMDECQLDMVGHSQWKCMEGNSISSRREMKNKAFPPTHDMHKKPLEPGLPHSLLQCVATGARLPFSPFHPRTHSCWSVFPLLGSPALLGFGGGRHPTLVLGRCTSAHGTTWIWASCSLPKSPQQQDAVQNLTTRPSAHRLVGGKPETLVAPWA